MDKLPLPRLSSLLQSFFILPKGQIFSPQIGSLITKHDLKYFLHRVCKKCLMCIIPGNSFNWISLLKQLDKIVPIHRYSTNLEMVDPNYIRSLVCLPWNRLHRCDSTDSLNSVLVGNQYVMSCENDIDSLCGITIFDNKSRPTHNRFVSGLLRGPVK